MEGDQITQTCKEFCNGKSMVPETVKTYLSSLQCAYLYFVLFCAPLLLNSCATENSLDIHANVPSASNAGNYLTGRVAYNNHDLNDATLSFRDALKKKSERGLVATTKLYRGTRGWKFRSRYQARRACFETEANFNIYASCNWITRR